MQGAPLASESASILVTDDSGVQRLQARGGSMLPFVPSGSWLTVRPYAGEHLQPGDLVVYPGVLGMVAHRVVAAGGVAPNQVLRVRGDAQRADEAMSGEAVAFVVVAVARGRLRYRTAGRLGRACAAAALHGGPLLPWLADVARRIARARR